MTLSKRERFLVAVAGATACILVIWRFLHEPLLARRGEALAYLEENRFHLQREQARLVREGDLASRLGSLAAQELLFEQRFPGRDSAAVLVWHLGLAEARSGVRIEGVHLTEVAAGVDPDQQRSPSLAELQVELTASGSFAEHLQFHQALEAVPLVLRVTAFSLNLPARPGEPEVEGLYQIGLHYRPEKPGTGTEPITHGVPMGRIDPFAGASIDKLLEQLQEAMEEPPDLEPEPPSAEEPPGEENAAGKGVELGG